MGSRGKEAKCHSLEKALCLFVSQEMFGFLHTFSPLQWDSFRLCIWLIACTHTEHRN